MISSQTGANITINGQYIKDLSFENPKAPAIYTLKDLKPEIGVTIDINANKLQENLFEVELVLKIEAKDKNEVLFIIELVEAGIFNVVKVEDSLLEEALFVDCPYLLFPFARKTIQDITMAGNFPPLSIDLVDFSALYKGKKNL